MLLLLDRRPRSDRLRAAVVRAVEAVPRLRQRVVDAPLDIARPRWEDDPTFDLDYHVRRYALSHEDGAPQARDARRPVPHHRADLRASVRSHASAVGADRARRAGEGCRDLLPPAPRRRRRGGRQRDPGGAHRRLARRGTAAACSRGAARRMAGAELRHAAGRGGRSSLRGGRRARPRAAAPRLDRADRALLVAACGARRARRGVRLPLAGGVAARAVRTRPPPVRLRSAVRAAAPHQAGARRADDRRHADRGRRRDGRLAAGARRRRCERRPDAGADQPAPLGRAGDRGRHRQPRDRRHGRAAAGHPRSAGAPARDPRPHDRAQGEPRARSAAELRRGPRRCCRVRWCARCPWSPARRCT